jgi:hypothetical protein
LETLEAASGLEAENNGFAVPKWAFFRRKQEFSRVFINI